MPFFQPPMPRLSKAVDLGGQSAIVTGASSGMGVEFARQFLASGLTTLVLGVRNITKGESVKQQLLTDPDVQAADTKPTILVMEIDLESFASVKRFAVQVKRELPRLDILMLNAGIGVLKREMTEDNHEKNVQVNYLSNALLLFDLLPSLEETSMQTGRPSRVTITGSRMHTKSQLVTRASGEPIANVLQYFDSPESYNSFTRYGDSKLLVVFLLYELKKRYSPEKVIINQFCPGMIKTGMSNVLPIYLRLPVKAVIALRARPVEQAGWVALNAVSVVGPESHGQLLGDMEIFEPIPFVKSSIGEDLQKKLWQETVEEVMKQGVNVFI